jgi:putative FmdB family regulatory protein
MPIYEYERPDGTTFEVIQAFDEEPFKKDPESGEPVRRVLHAPALHFKGKGFYNTDYGTRKRQREQAAEGGGSASAESSSQNGKAGDAAGASTDRKAATGDAKSGKTEKGSAKTSDAATASTK